MFPVWLRMEIPLRVWNLRVIPDKFQVRSRFAYRNSSFLNPWWTAPFENRRWTRWDVLDWFVESLLIDSRASHVSWDSRLRPFRSKIRFGYRKSHARPNSLRSKLSSRVDIISIRRYQHQRDLLEKNNNFVSIYRASLHRGTYPHRCSGLLNNAKVVV